MSLSGRMIMWTCIFTFIAFVVAEAREVKRGPSKCRTRFTFSRPTNENVSSILIGIKNKHLHRKLSFNHDEVGITQPVKGSNPFPSCLGYAKKTKNDSKVHEYGSSIDDATTICSNTTLDGWRLLRFHKRVGYGKQCYRRVQNAVLNWDFEAQKGKKSMGILSATSINTKTDASTRLGETGPRFTVPRRGLLATFTEIWLPRPLKSLFVVNPVHVVYEVKNAHSLPKALFSSTAYATLNGHLLAGEERVTVVWRKDRDEVDVEIVSFSRSAPSIGGKLIWPLIGRMQKQFFLSEMNHLDKVAKE